MSNKTVVFKVSYGENTHRFSIERENISIQKLREILGKIFGNSLRYHLTYKDNDEDLITLKSEHDLIEALKVFPGQNDVIRLQLTPKRGQRRHRFMNKEGNVSKNDADSEKEDEAQNNASSSDEETRKDPHFNFSRQFRKWGKTFEHSMKDIMEKLPTGDNKNDFVNKLTQQFRNSDFVKRVGRFANKDHVEHDQEESHQHLCHHNPFRFGNKWGSRLSGRRERTVVSVSEKMTKTWTIRNHSPFVWPAGCTLTYCGGDKLTAEAGFTFQKEVGPHEDVEIQFTFTSPNQPGKYWSLYRMATPEGNVFGRGIRIFLEVVKKDEEEEVQKPNVVVEDIKKPNVVVIEEVPQETVSVIVEEAPQETVVVEEIVAEEEAPGPFDDLIKALKDMGFDDRQLNLRYLESYGGDIMTVIEKLLSFE